MTQQRWYVSGKRSKKKGGKHDTLLSGDAVTNAGGNIASQISDPKSVVVHCQDGHTVGTALQFETTHKNKSTRGLSQAFGLRL